MLELKEILFFYVSGWLVGPFAILINLTRQNSIHELCFIFISIMLGSISASTCFFLLPKILRKYYIKTLKKVIKFFKISEKKIELMHFQVIQKGLFYILFFGFFLSPVAEILVLIYLGILNVPTKQFLIMAFMSTVCFGVLITLITLFLPSIYMIILDLFLYR